MGGSEGPWEAEDPGVERRDRVARAWPPEPGRGLRQDNTAPEAGPLRLPPSASGSRCKGQWTSGRWPGWEGAQPWHRWRPWGWAAPGKARSLGRPVDALWEGRALGGRGSKQRVDSGPPRGDTGTRPREQYTGVGALPGEPEPQSCGSPTRDLSSSGFCTLDQVLLS